MPNIIGMTEEEAIEALEDADFKPQVADTSFGVSLPPGRVFCKNQNQVR